MSSIATPLIETFPVGMLQCNCTIAVCPDTREALVVDPGGDFDLIQRRLTALDARVSWVLHTHAHLDHVCATRDVWATGGASQCHCGFHKGDQWLIENLHIQAQLLPLPYKPLDCVDHWLTDGESVRIGTSLRLDVCHTPGHTPGSVCFLLSSRDKPVRILSGDTLFQGSIGRTDLWGGDYDLILRSIHQKLLQWPDEISVFPGHGPETTLAEEKETNPFLQDGAHS